MSTADQTVEGQVDEGSTPNAAEAEAETRALAMGWRPKDQYKGPDDKWIPASEYLRRGEEVLPIVRNENRRLHTKVEELSAQITSLNAALAENRTSMGDFVKFQQELLQDKLSQQRQQLLAARREAREEGDDARLDKIETQLDDNREALRKVKDAPPPVAKTTAAPASNPENDPVYREWESRNPWLKEETEEAMAKQGAAMRFAQSAAEAKLKGAEFFRFVDEKLAKAFPQRAATSKTEDGGRHAGGAARSGFDALPPEAQAQAKADAKRFVGPNKVFKDEKAWFAHFVKQYNA